MTSHELVTLSAVLFNQAKHYYQFGNYTFARHQFTKVIALTPDAAAAWFQRGLVYMKLGLWQEAIEDFTQALALGARDVFGARGLAYLGLAEDIQDLQGWTLYNQSKADLEAALAQQPEDQVIQALGYVCEQLDAWGEAT
ncbi:tetratricopeptide repeat protein [Anthocerotibacter panamensis]|uniref:tetratricopeptide repeat protein n=1 Tax=Anthocerotibacter panamensis TaxID=2857077 RepID=UPI001C406A0A|nr:tetratricopeptide repeat protein [Anthocerotibacter panamensis]